MQVEFPIHLLLSSHFSPGYLLGMLEVSGVSQVLLVLFWDLKMVTSRPLQILFLSEQVCPTKDWAPLASMVKLAQAPLERDPHLTLGQAAAGGGVGARRFGYKVLVTQSSASAKMFPYLALIDWENKTL